MTVYADVLLVVNLVMNGLILALTAWAAGTDCQRWRIVAAAALGAVYVLAGAYPGFEGLLHFSVRAGVSGLMVAVAFGWKSLGSMLFLWGVFYLISFFLGGAAAGWWFFFREASPGDALTAVGWQDTVAGVAVGIAMAAVFVRRLTSRVRRRRLLCPVHVRLGVREAMFTALLDTGNDLYTALEGRPVLLAEHSALSSLFAPAVNDFLAARPEGEWLTDFTVCADQDFVRGITVIACRSVGGRGLLLGLKPDLLEVDAGDGMVAVPKAAIGLVRGVLPPGQNYAALLHPAMIRPAGRKENYLCA